MMIDKVSGIGPGYEPRKTNHIPKTEGAVRGSDNVTISDEAARAAVAARTAKLAQSAQDSGRADKLKEIKARLQKGEFDNPSEEMLAGAADKLADVLLGVTGGAGRAR